MLAKSHLATSWQTDGSGKKTVPPLSIARSILRLLGRSMDFFVSGIRKPLSFAARMCRNVFSLPGVTQDTIAGLALLMDESSMMRTILLRPSSRSP